MLDTSKIPDKVLEAIANNMGRDDEPLEQYLPQIAELTWDNAFWRWCNWHGLIDWAEPMLKTILALKQAETGWKGKPCLFSVRFLESHNVLVVTPQDGSGEQEIQRIIKEIEEAGWDTDKIRESDPSAFSLDSYWFYLELWPKD